MRDFIKKYHCLLFGHKPKLCVDGKDKMFWKCERCSKEKYDIDREEAEFWGLNES